VSDSCSNAFSAGLLTQLKDFVNRRAKADVDLVSIRRNNRPTITFKHNNKQTGRLICADSMDGGRF
jgi:hypothetical protein